MRRLSKLASLSFVLALSAVTAQHKTATAQNQPVGSDTEVRATLQKLYAAWSELDPAKAAPFYAKDPDLTFFDVAPLKYTGWSEYAAGVPKAFVDYRSGTFTLNDDLRIHRCGNLAWASATWRGDLVRKTGGTQHMEGRYTAVLEKHGRDWLVVHEHMSVPAQ